MIVSLFPLAALAAIAASMPTGTDNPSFFYEPLTIKFSGGPASYELKFPADGNTYPTNNPLSISLISGSSPSGHFDFLHYCNFLYTTPQYDPKNPVLVQQGKDIAVGPPQQITGVNCQPTPGGSNTCLPVYASCEWCGGAWGGCFIGSCCSGYCAGTKCRSTS